jgi:hypothetical protein
MPPALPSTTLPYTSTSGDEETTMPAPQTQDASPNPFRLRELLRMIAE